MKKSKRIYWAAGAIVIIFIIAAYITSGAAEVETVTAGKGTIQRTVVENGIVDAKAAHDLYTDAGGKVISLPVEVGQMVQKGQVIAALDNTEIALQISSTQSQLSQVKAAVLSQQASLSGIGTELAAAEKHFVRIEQLFKAGGASQVDYDNASFTVEKLQKSFDELSTSLNYARQQEKSLEDALRIAQDSNNKLTIRSPIEGKLMYLNCEEGQVLMPGAQVAGVAVSGELEVRADILSDDIAEVAEGQNVLVTAPVLGDTVLTGQVIKVYPQAEEKMSALGVIQRRVPVIISLEEGGILKPGFEVRVEINTVKKDNVLILPRGSIKVSQNNQKEILVVRNNKTETRIVETGVYDSNNIEIISGVKEGEQVVKDAGSSISAGTRVKIIQ